MHSTSHNHRKDEKFNAQLVLEIIMGNTLSIWGQLKSLFEISRKTKLNSLLLT